MKIEQHQWTGTQGWAPPFDRTLHESAQLIFAFGAPAALRRADVIGPLRARYPRAHLLGCSTAGEICDTRVSDDSLVVTAVRFDHSHVRTAHVSMNDAAGSLHAGEHLGQTLPHAIETEGQGAKEKLTHVLVLSDGLKVTGSDLVRGLRNRLPEEVTITGGLAGDGTHFGETLVFRDGRAQPEIIAAVGLYGSRLQVGFGSMGGWDPFGPERLITRSRGNVLLELDGRPALGLYKQYLGEHAHGLPATGLLFPLSVHMKRELASCITIREFICELLRDLRRTERVRHAHCEERDAARRIQLLCAAARCARCCTHRALESRRRDRRLLLSLAATASKTVPLGRVHWAKKTDILRAKFSAQRSADSASGRTRAQRRVRTFCIMRRVSSARGARGSASREGSMPWTFLNDL